MGYNSDKLIHRIHSVLCNKKPPIWFVSIFFLNISHVVYFFIVVDMDIFLIPCFKCRQSDLETSSHSSLTLSLLWLFLVYALSCVCGSLYIFVMWLRDHISMDNLWICMWVLFKNCILSYYFTQDQVQWVWIGIHVGSTVFLFFTVVFLLAICLCISCCFTHLGFCVLCFLFLVAIFFYFFLNCDYSYFRFYIELEIAHCLGVIKDGFLRWDFMG